MYVTKVKSILFFFNILIANNKSNSLKKKFIHKTNLSCAMNHNQSFHKMNQDTFINFKFCRQTTMVNYRRVNDN